MHIIVNSFELEVCAKLFFVRLWRWQVCWTPYEGLLFDRVG